MFSIENWSKNVDESLAYSVIHVEIEFLLAFHLPARISANVKIFVFLFAGVSSGPTKHPRSFAGYMFVTFVALSKRFLSS